MDRIAVLEQVALESLSGTPQPDLLERASREAHMLAGALGSFGFPVGSQLAAEIEDTLRTLATPEDGYALSFKIVALRNALEEHALPELPDAGEEVSTLPTVLYLGTGGSFLNALQSAEDIRVVLQPGTALPTLIILGALEPGLLEEAGRVAAGKEVPLVALTSGLIGLKERVAALRQGVLRFLDQDRDLSQLVEEIRRLAHQDEFRPRVLALDDDPIILTVLRHLLLGQGIELETVSTPEEFWLSLRRQKPDLVLLDLELPDYSGQEICSSLRAEPSTEDIPVIVITATSDREVLENLFAVGVDDCLRKPLSSRELHFRIRNRLQRVRTIRRHGLFESETGVWTREHSGPLFQRILNLAERNQRSASIALIQFRGARMVEGVRTLANSLRGEDLVARWRPDTFLVGLYGAGLDDSAFRINNELQKLLRDFSLEGWAGVAEFPQDGSNFDILVERARACLEIACSQASGQVISYGHSSPSESVEMVDVVLVEDDALLGAVILHALENRGYRARWLQDGKAAMETLSGNHTQLRPRVVVLDIDLPGASGLEVLRRLRDEGVLRRTRVLMLTVRANERETLETLALGAYDHLAKPCSLQVLLQRVQLALSA